MLQSSINKSFKVIKGLKEMKRCQKEKEQGKTRWKYGCQSRQRREDPGEKESDTSE
jgi:hypothetical protein